jgi:hypothetical protein
MKIVILKEIWAYEHHYATNIALAEDVALSE